MTPRNSLLLVGFLAVCALAAQAAEWDLLIKGGRVIDPKNGIDAPRDVAIVKGKIVRVARDLPAAQASRVADAAGLYVVPGVIDIHTHNYAGTGIKALTGDSSVYPDPLSFRSGITTMVDAGSAGWRNFADFRQRAIDRAQTRVLAFVNIVADGMSLASEDDPATMQPQQVARVARENPGVVVGVKTAHYAGAGWHAVDRSLEAGRLANLPVMVDFGTLKPERTLASLLGERLRKGDIYTHCYSGWRGELSADGKVSAAMIEGRQRGVLFDLGHGAGSFYWWVAVPAVQQGFLPDIISTDLHTGSMNAGMKDMLNVMSKMLNLGMPLTDVIRASTWAPAQTIRHTELGHLSEGAVADVTVLRLEEGAFGFIDAAGARRAGTRRLTAEVTIRGGAVMWDLNGRAATDWTKFTYKRQRP
jgi:dihydroorotase